VSTVLYEGMFLLDSALASKDWASLEKHVEDILTRHGAETLHTERWPDRRLAYEVKGCRKGTYYLTYFNAPKNAISEMLHDVELSERILRVLFISEEGLEEEMERRKRREIDIPPADLPFTKERHTYDTDGRFRRGGQAVVAAAQDTGKEDDDSSVGSADSADSADSDDSDAKPDDDR
jgi:ribosomal protein S6